MKTKSTKKFLHLLIALVFLLAQLTAFGALDISAAGEKSTSIHLKGVVLDSDIVYVGLSYMGAPLTNFAGQYNENGLFLMSTGAGGFTIKDDGLDHLPMVTAFIVNGDTYIVNPPESRDPRIKVGVEGNLGSGTNNYWILDRATDAVISIVKTADPGPYLPGDTVDYTFTVTNTGGKDLFDVYVEDLTIGFTSTIVSLAKGTNYVFNKSYMIPLDYASATFTNTAAAYGKYGLPDLFETEIWDEDTAEVNVTIFIEEPSLSISKLADISEGEVGDTVHYTITVTNNGNVPLEDVMLSDPKLDITDGPFDLAVGASHTALGSYTLTASELAEGYYTNTAEAWVYYESELIEVSDVETVDVLPTLAMEITKTVDHANIYTDESVIYTITVKNTSNITLENIVVTDSLLGYIDTIASLPSGHTWTVDLPETYDEAGLYINTATAEYGIATDDYMMVYDSAQVTVAPLGTITIFKNFDEDNYDPETLFTFLIKDESGEVTLDEVEVALGGYASSIKLPAGTYIVHELSKPGWVLRTGTENDQLAEIGGDSYFSPSVYFYNDRVQEPSGTIRISKTILNRPDDMTEFTVTITDGEETWTRTIHQGEGGTAVLTELPVGTYTITEVSKPGYTTVSTNPITVPISESVDYYEVGFTNSLNPPVIQYGTITVTKDVTNVDNDLTEFTVIINGIYTLTVKEGTPASITVPVGTYTVTETAKDGYTNVSITPATFTLTTAGQTVAVVNEKIIIPPRGSLTVVKNFEDGVTDDTAFSVTITGPDGYYRVISIAQGLPVTMDDLALGQYALTEESTEGYVTVGDADVTVILTDDAKDATVTFTNAAEEIDIPDEEVPEDEPDLPQTGGLHPSAFFGLGSLLALSGMLFLFIQKRREQLTF